MIAHSQSSHFWLKLMTVNNVGNSGARHKREKSGRVLFHPLSKSEFLIYSTPKNRNEAPSSWPKPRSTTTADRD